MKARVNGTREIVTIMKNIGYPGGYVASNGRTYHDEDLTLIVDEDPDYWTRLEHQYAGMAMGGMCTNHSWDKCTWEVIANDAYEAAHALVEKMKEADR